MHRVLVPFALCAAAAAQVPFGHLIYVNGAPSATSPAMGIIDPVLATVTHIVPLTGSLHQHGSRTVAIDPQAPHVLYSITGLSLSSSASVPVLTLTGNRFVRTNLPVSLGAPGVPFHLRWASGHGMLLLGRGGQVNRMFLRDMATGVVTSQPTANMLPNFATDMVCIGSKAYAVSEGDGSATATGTIVEWDLVANTDRVVGSNYPPLLAVADYFGTLLCGDGNGGVHIVDPVSGAISPFTVMPGKVTSLATDGAGGAFAVSELLQSWHVLSVTSPAAPVYSTTIRIDDLVFAPGPVPTMLTFGSGCVGSNSTTPALDFTGPPALGSSFAVTLAGALPGAAAVLIHGSSRVFDPFGPLPRDLGILGMFGCTQYVDLVGMLPVITGPGGSAQFALSVPNNPSLAGARLPLQWLCLDAAANPFGATTSNGAEAHLY